MIPTPDKFSTRLDAESYAGLLRRLLPRGKIWSVDHPLSGLRAFLLGIGAEPARAHNRLLDVLEEADPSTTDDLIDDWERILGLPDPTDPSPPVTLADRRAVAHAKFIARGGMQPQNIYDIAQAAGYESDIEVQVPTLFRADESASDERSYDWDSWTFVWYVWRENPPALGWDRLLALLNIVKHANTIVIAIDGLRVDEVATPT